MTQICMTAQLCKCQLLRAGHSGELYIGLGMDHTQRSPPALTALPAQSYTGTTPGKPVPSIARVRLSSVGRESRGVDASGPLGEYPELYQAAV